MDGLTLPPDNRIGPNCGVTAIAVIAKVPFDHVWEMCRKLSPACSKPRWRGRTTLRLLVELLKKLDVKHQVMEQSGRISLHRFTDWYAPKSKTYLVRVGNHFVVVRNGHGIDQFGLRKISDSKLRRKMVTHIIEII